MHTSFKMRLGALILSTSFAALASASAMAQDLERVNLTLGISVPNTNSAPMIWAIQTGIFDTLGLDLDYSVTRTLTTTEATTGRLPLGLAGSTTIFPAVDEERPIKLVLNAASGNGSAFITVVNDSPFRSIEDLSGQTVGVIGATGPGYGGAKAYSDKVVAGGGEEFEIIARRDAASNGAALTTGEIAAAIGTPVYFDQIQAGQYRLLLDAGTDEARAITGAEVPNVGFFGLDTTLEENREAVVRYIAGMRVAIDALQNASDAEIAEIMQRDDNFSPSVVSSEALTEQLRLGRPFFPQNGGFISPEEWEEALALWSTWGLQVASGEVDLTSPKFSYENVVDMSFWNEATALVESVEFTPEQRGE